MGGAAPADDGAAARCALRSTWARRWRPAMLSAADAAAYAAYTARMRRFAAALAPMFSRMPPRLGGGDMVGSIGIAAHRLADTQAGTSRHARAAAHRRHECLRPARENLRFARRSRAHSAFDAVLGANFGPRSPGTVLTLLYRLAAESAAGDQGLSQPKGGMGALCNALAKAAMAAGAEIRTGGAGGQDSCRSRSRLRAWSWNRASASRHAM